MLNRESALALMTMTILSSSVDSSIATETIDLWPEGGPPGFRHERPESLDDQTGDDQRRDRWIGYVSVPTLTIHHAPARRATGTAVLVLPGGRYSHIVIDKEGHDVARWLNTLGVSAAVLKYRTHEPDQELSDAYLDAAAATAVVDARRAMRLLRSRANEWRLAPDKIGVMGFSAGGHLASRLVATSDAGDPAAKEPLERTSCRPDFVALVYGVPRETTFDFISKPPPFFIIGSNDDPYISASQPVRFAQALAEAGISFELHAFREGGHGFALGLNGGGVRWWPTLFEEWMRDLGLLDRATKPVAGRTTTAQ
jgi:acetyl esterase/lipase